MQEVRLACAVRDVTLSEFVRDAVLAAAERTLNPTDATRAQAVADAVLREFAKDRC